ncbi:MAG: CHAT domain-containing protein [Planctomycetota bacterium]|jgi:hypothetical protein
MNTRLIIQETGGQVRVGVLPAGQLAPSWAGQAEAWEAPLSAEQAEGLRWYLEDYLTAPFAVWEDRGENIRRALPDWGKGLFRSVFGDGPRAEKYGEVRNGAFDIWIESDSPGFLALPWELLCDPADGRHLAVEGTGINRTISATTQESTAADSKTLRVLMVIARPERTADVDYQMIARPMLKRLALVSGRVELDVLRPPTVEALRAKLGGAGKDGGYDILHFDGHGVFAAGGSGPAQRSPHRYDGPMGVLEFENTKGESDAVSAEDFAAMMKDAGIGLLIFNACQSGMLAGGVGPEAGIATRMLRAGADAVVAMGYSVYAVAAAEFMAAFYEDLFHGKTVAEAVSAGRLQMKRANLRPSPKGRLPLADWIVPVHYARREVSFPQLKTQTERKLSLADTLEAVRQAGEQALDAAASGPGDPGRRGDGDPRRGRHGQDGAGQGLRAVAAGLRRGGPSATGAAPLIRAGRGDVRGRRRGDAGGPGRLRPRLRRPGLRTPGPAGRGPGAAPKSPDAADLGQLRDGPLHARPGPRHAAPGRG